MKRIIFIIFLISFISISVSAQENIIYDKITCIFRDSNIENKCYTETTPFFSCTGVGSCTMEVYGEQGTKIIFRNSCFDGTLDYGIGMNMGNYFNLKCGEGEQLPVSEPNIEQTQETTEQTQEKNIILAKEDIKCIFENPGSYQYCYTEDKKYVCSGGESCMNTVSEEKGRILNWRSSCEGYASTNVDGNNEEIRFKCNSNQIPTIEATPIKPNLLNNIYYFYSETCSYCEGMEEELNKLSNYFFISIIKVDINKQPELAQKFEVDSIPTVVLLKNEGGFTKFSGKTDYLTLVNWIKSSLSTTEKPISILKEQVKCVFSNSNTSQNCYTSDGRFGCGGDKVTSEEPFTNCRVDVSGEKGATITWKSSCGGYISTTIDGINENADFQCISQEQITEEQFLGKGFKYVYWQCYDGFEFKPDNSAICKPAEAWKQEAENFCKGHCYKDKCGVNSFSISGDCYPDTDIEEAIFTKPVETKPAEEAIETNEEEILICKDSCPLEGKCYPFGYRKSSKFCFDDGTFKKQLKSNENCENNFECKSNLCVDNQCISGSVWAKFLRWIGNFGGE